MYIGMLHFKIK